MTRGTTGPQNEYARPGRIVVVPYRGYNTAVGERLEVLAWVVGIGVMLAVAAVRPNLGYLAAILGFAPGLIVWAFAQTLSRGETGDVRRPPRPWRRRPRGPRRA